MEVEIQVVRILRIEVWITYIQSQWIGVVNHWRKLCDAGLVDPGIVIEPDVFSIPQIGAPEKSGQEMVVGLADIFFTTTHLAGQLRDLILQSRAVRRVFAAEAIGDTGTMILKYG